MLKERPGPSRLKREQDFLGGKFPKNSWEGRGRGLPESDVRRYAMVNYPQQLVKYIATAWTRPYHHQLFAV